jgi:hypothetical protein
LELHFERGNGNDVNDNNNGNNKTAGDRDTEELRELQEEEILNLDLDLAEGLAQEIRNSITFDVYAVEMDVDIGITLVRNSQTTRRGGIGSGDASRMLLSPGGKVMESPMRGPGGTPLFDYQHVGSNQFAVM